MKRINFTGIIILLISLGVNGQNTGFGGRRCLIKTNAVNGTYGFLNGAQAELLLHRNVTLSVGFDFINANVKQTYTDGEVVTGGKITMNDKADISYTGFNMEVRKYFSDIPAPHGFYLRAAYRKGNLNVNEGSFSSNLFDNGSPSQIITYSLIGVPVSGLSGGFGYQKAIKTWLFAGAYISYDYTWYGDIIEGVPARTFSGIGKNFGANIYAFDKSAKKKEPGLSSNGISGVLQIGFLLF